MRIAAIVTIGTSLLLSIPTFAQDAEENLREFVVHETNEMGKDIYRDSRVSSRQDTSACFIYVSHKANGDPWLRLQVRHAGFKSLGFTSVKFTKGNVSLLMNPGKDLIQTGNNGVMQWEWYDAPPDENEVKAIRAIVAGPGVTLTLTGPRGEVTRELSETERLAMENMMYQAIDLGQRYEKK